MRVAAHVPEAADRVDDARLGLVLDRRRGGGEDGDGVEQPGAGVAEAVPAMRGEQDRLSRNDPPRLAVHGELGLALDDEDRLLHLEVRVEGGSRPGLRPLLHDAELSGAGGCGRVQPRPHALAPLDELDLGISHDRATDRRGRQRALPACPGV